MGWRNFGLINLIEFDSSFTAPPPSIIRWGAGRHEEFRREQTVDSKPGYSCRSKSHPLCSDVIILIISHVFQIGRSHCEGGWMSSLYWSQDSNLLGRAETLWPGGRAATKAVDEVGHPRPLSFQLDQILRLDFYLSASHWFFSTLCALWWQPSCGVHHWLPGWLLRPHVRVNPHDYVLPVQNLMPTIRYKILKGSEEDSKAPYFVRNQNKYPNLLPQPGIKIDCVSIPLNLLKTTDDQILMTGWEELRHLPHPHHRLDPQVMLTMLTLLLAYTYTWNASNYGCKWARIDIGHIALESRRKYRVSFLNGPSQKCLSASQ